MNGLYSLDELTKSIIDEYKLPYSGGREEFATYRQRIYREVVKLRLVDSAVKRVNPETKRKCMYFTEQHRQRILSERTLYDYVRANSSSEHIRSEPRYKEIQQQIRIRRENYIEQLSDLNNEEDVNPNDPAISDDDFRSAKLHMMLEALFHLYFTPINDSLLRNDLDRILKKDDLGLMVEDIDAERRLSHPEDNYFSRRKT